MTETLPHVDFANIINYARLEEAKITAKREAHAELSTLITANNGIAPEARKELDSIFLGFEYGCMLDSTEVAVKVRKLLMESIATHESETAARKKELADANQTIKDNMDHIRRSLIAITKAAPKDRELWVEHGNVLVRRTMSMVQGHGDIERYVRLIVEGTMFWGIT